MPPEGNGVLVPYITAWSTEQDLPGEVVERPGFGIAYADESPTDRDVQGVLWHRTASRPRQGRPDFGVTHPLRQRRAMRRLLCQVCAGPADRTEDGVLWVLKDHRGDWPGWPAGMGVTEPPVCLACARLAVKVCPALRRGAVWVRVREFPVAGAQGALYRADRTSPVMVRRTVVAFEDPAIRWLCATNLVRELRGCAVVPVE